MDDFITDVKVLVTMLSAVLAQAEQSSPEGGQMAYWTDAYPPMIEQIGKVLVDLGKAKLTK